MKVFMMQFINTFTGVRMNNACELVQTLFRHHKEQNRKSGLASETSQVLTLLFA